MVKRRQPQDLEAAAAARSISKTAKGMIRPWIVSAVVTLFAAVTNIACHESAQRDRQLEAEAEWKRVRAEFKVRLANEQVKDGRVEEALEVLHEAVALDPSAPAHHILLAKCYLEKGDLAAACAAIDHAEAVSGTSAEIAYARGMIAERRAWHDEAMQHYLEAVNLEPANVDYVLAAGELLVAVGRAAEAKAFLDEQIQDLHATELLLLLRARICVLLSDLEQAAADFRAAEDLLVDHRWAAEQYGLVLVRLGRHAKALAVLRPLVESADRLPDMTSAAVANSPAAVRALATCHLRLKSPQQAKSLLEEHVQRYSEDGRAWWLLAESCVRLGDWNGALDSAKRGERVAPGMSGWKLLRAYSTQNSGDTETAITCLKSILSKQPNDVLAHVLLAQVYEQSDNLDLALSHYETAHRLDPHHQVAPAKLRNVPGEK